MSKAEQRTWTAEQRQCIEARGGTVLVSAAAGSGKTSVLVERVVSRVLDENAPVDVDRLLIVTFTNAAAAEMKQRLASALMERAAERPDDRRLQRQQMLLPRAAIGTVDSFCSSLLREQFHRLGLPPSFRVGEGPETAQLRDEALSEAVEEAYQRGGPAFRRLASLLSPGKSDRGVFDAVEKLYDFIQSHPDPGGWLDAQREAYAADAPVEQTAWGRAVMERAVDILRAAASLLGRAAAAAEEEPAMAAAWGDFLRREGAMLRAAAQNLSGMDWDTAQAAAAGLTFDRLPPLRNYEDETRKERVKSLRGRAKDEIRKRLPPLFCGTAGHCREDIAALAPLAGALFDTVRGFSARFAEKKRARGLVDYNDLEHLSLSLLVDGGGNRTPLARELSGRYDEVMVDEYQDTNAVQDALYRALSRDERNLFLVGDVKQSIYGFRQARPSLFLGRRESYAPYDGRSFPATVTLGNNFRSRAEVTDAVNFVFRQLMTRPVSGMDYDAREELIPSASYPAGEGCETELLLVDGGTRAETDEADAAEARVIAARIRRLMAEFRVSGKGGGRPARYGDFCILLRSKNAHARAYADELARCGVPVWTASAGGFFESSEVAAAVSLLEAIDNPTQEVPLLAVLMSPAFGFSPDDMAAVRLAGRDLSLFAALRKTARLGEDADLRRRAADFLARLDRWRLLAVTLPADRLLHRLYEEGGLLAAASAMPGGAQRTGNLRMLHDMACGFEQRGFRGLSAFVRYLRRARESRDLSTPAAGSENAVHILSIHHSKGLEFPVVFLAGLGRQFNRESTTAALLLHADMGVGFKRRDEETLCEWNTLPRSAVSLTITRSERAEELRVLYVAMTRAREKLCMVMTLRDPASRLASLAAGVGEEDALPAYTVLGAGGMGDWILSAALRHPSGGHLRALAGDDALSVRPADFPWRVEVLRSPEPEEAGQAGRASAQPDPALMETLSRRMAWSYPYAAVSALPSKLAASALSHGEVQREHVASARPAFLSAGGLTPAERGTALHTFMQFADYARAEADPRAEADRLTAGGFLTPEQRHAIPLERVAAFFAGALYARMKSAAELFREVRFAVDIPAAELLPEGAPAGDDRLVIQGIADCVLREGGTLTVVDYKTDHVTDGAVLVGRYREQLRVYARALERTLGLPVRQALLYSFALGRTVDATAAIR